ncbi:MAG TPA: hypothetical protein VF699_12485 [Caulobacteraceae bacterium]
MNERPTGRPRPSRAGRRSAVLALAGCFAALAACSTQAPKSGVLSAYDGLAPRGGTLRTGISERRDEAALAKAALVALRPTEIAAAPGTAWLNAPQADGARP